MSAERPAPSLEILLGALNEVDTKVNDLTETLHASAQITDNVLLELSMQVAFILQTLRITEVPHGALVGLDGKLPSVTKTGAQVYMERGRAIMIKQREAALHAQSLSAESPAIENAAAPVKANGQDPDAAVEHVGPKRVTH